MAQSVGEETVAVAKAFLKLNAESRRLEEIAEKKMPDLNCLDVESAISQVIGTARSMGLEVK